MDKRNVVFGCGDTLSICNILGDPMPQLALEAEMPATENAPDNLKEKS